MVYIVMGVSGAGKSTIASMLAGKLDLPFFDADDFHPPENIEKMRSGTPLSDKDRAPWLARLAQKLDEWNFAGGAVLACSALKERYRRALADGGKGAVRLIFLKGDIETILPRMELRDSHFFPAALLESQLREIEEPVGALTVSIDQSPPEIVRQIERALAEPHL